MSLEHPWDAPCAPTYLGYADGVAYNVPFGTPIGAYDYKTGTGTVRSPGVYMVPDTPAHAFNGPIPLSDNSQATIRNDAGISKLQYTYALSQSAYLRAYGTPSTRTGCRITRSPAQRAKASRRCRPPRQYQLVTHTSGGALDFQDQLNDQNLLTLDGNYTTAGVIRWNNGSAAGNDSPIGYMAKTAPALAATEIRTIFLAAPSATPYRV